MGQIWGFFRLFSVRSLSFLPFSLTRSLSMVCLIQLAITPTAPLYVGLTTLTSPCHVEHRPPQCSGHLMPPLYFRPGRNKANQLLGVSPLSRQPSELPLNEGLFVRIHIRFRSDWEMNLFMCLKMMYIKHSKRHNIIHLN